MRTQAHFARRRVTSPTPLRSHAHCLGAPAFHTRPSARIARNWLPACRTVPSVSANRACDLAHGPRAPEDPARVPQQSQPIKTPNAYEIITFTRIIVSLLERT